MSSKHNGPVQATPYPLQRISPPIMPLLAEAQANASITTISSTLNTKLSLLTEQILHLQSVGEELIKKFQRDSDLHNVQCSIIKRPGTVFYLYKRQNDTQFFSIISPNEWSGLFKFDFLGSYLLEADMTWTSKDSF